jgi:hypothetical protein
MVSIYTVCYIKPFFISIQKQQLDRHCKDEYQLKVINNGKDESIRTEIRKVCSDLKIECIDYDRSSTIPDFCSQSHCVALEYGLNNYIRKEDPENIIVIMDNDVFAFKDFSFIDLLNSKKIAGLYQQRNINNVEYEYFSAIFIMFKNDIDISEFSFFRGVGDTGSGTAELIKKYPSEYVKHTAAIDLETDYIFKGVVEQFPYQKQYKCQFIGGCFIHYYRGSNWAESDPNYHSNKLNFVINFLKDYTVYNINLNDKVLYSTAHADKGYNGVDYNYKNYKFNDK